MGKENSKIVNKNVDSTSIQNSQSRIIENFIIVWLDSNINESKSDYQNSLNHLRHIVNSIRTFKNLDQCIDFLNSIVNEKIFLIISGSYVEQILPHIQDNQQINSIYIFCYQTSNYEPLTKQSNKIKGVYNQIESICEILKQNINQSNQELTPLSVLKLPSVINLNELDQSFMYSQILKEIILDMEYNDNQRYELVQFCRIQYANNNYEMQIIKEFENSYKSHTPIWWYTRECFLYSMLNRALRLQDIDIIIKMAFFIRDLHEQIKDLHKQTNIQHQLIVYRGQSFLNENFQMIKNSSGALLSFNSFLSTSTDRNISLEFAQRSSHQLNHIGILFQMEINPMISSTPFASLDNISYYSTKEKEILFSMHTIFRINDIKKFNENIWQINLILTNDKDEQLNRLTIHLRQTIQQPTGLRRLAKLMLEMDEINKAEDIYKKLLEITSDDNKQEISFIYNQLGVICEKRSDLSNALKYYEKSLEIDLDYLPTNHPDFAATYSNIGEIYRQQEDFNQAIDYYKKALEIELNSPDPNYINIASFHNNIGMVYKQQGKYEEALKNYQYTLEIELNHLPSTHPDLARTYNNISGVYYSMKDYSTSLIYLEKTLEIQQKSLLPTHILLAQLYSNIAHVLGALERYDEAIKYAEKSVEIARHTLDEDNHQVQYFQSYLEKLRTIKT